MLAYQHGKIYKIVCNNSGKQYIGSTTLKYLSSRLAQHKVDSKRNKIMTSREIIEGGNYSIILVELFPCNSKDELIKRERYYIETLECVNKCIPGRTDKEYREANKEKIKQYREANKEYIKEKNKEYYQANKEYIDKKNKEYREANIEYLNQKKKEKYNCECGGKYNYTHKARHFKSKKHQSFIKP